METHTTQNNQEPAQGQGQLVAQGDQPRQMADCLQVLLECENCRSKLQKDAFSSNVWSSAVHHDFNPQASTRGHTMWTCKNCRAQKVCADERSRAKCCSSCSVLLKIPDNCTPSQAAKPKRVRVCNGCKSSKKIRRFETEKPEEEQSNHSTAADQAAEESSGQGCTVESYTKMSDIDRCAMCGGSADLARFNNAYQISCGDPVRIWRIPLGPVGDEIRHLLIGTDKTANEHGTEVLYACEHCASILGCRCAYQIKEIDLDLEQCIDRTPNQEQKLQRDRDGLLQLAQQLP